ncbi:S2/P23 family protein [Borrelia duttonii]|uniref:P23-like cell envelope protein n=1 Tax=Borrelia duttonii (strain Ly) TaxID=412419 RepID=B5RND8_BORDL|nr:p23-like cell envelope protein [Borrelia duttonii Ly]
MKKIIILLALFIIILSMASCFLDDQIDYSKVQLDQALSNIISKYNHNKLKDLQKENVEEEEEQTTFEVIEGQKEQCMCISCWLWCSCPKPKCYITWMKIKAKEIVDQDKKVIAALKDKLRYSYSVSPIKYNNNYSNYVMPLILFESMDENIEVTSFNLTDHKNLDFNNKGVLGGWIQGIPKVEKSSEEGYKNVYPYGILNAISPNGGEELISAFKSLYKNGKWDFMKAEIKVKDKTNNQESTHNILLDGKLFNEFIKTVINKHKGTTTANTKFQVPINN